MSTQLKYDTLYSTLFEKAKKNYSKDGRIDYLEFNTFYVAKKTGKKWNILWKFSREKLSDFCSEIIAPSSYVGVEIFNTKLSNDVLEKAYSSLISKGIEKSMDTNAFVYYLAKKFFQENCLEYKKQ